MVLKKPEKDVWIQISDVSSSMSAVLHLDFWKFED